MTPLEIEILMHYACRADDYRNGDHSAPAVKEAILRFVENELLTLYGFNIEYLKDGGMMARYEITPRARAYLDALCEVPLPEPKWVMPEPWPQTKFPFFSRVSSIGDRSEPTQPLPNP